MGDEGSVMSLLLTADIRIMRLMEDVRKGTVLSAMIVVGEVRWLVNDFFFNKFIDLFYIFLAFTLLIRQIPLTLYSCDGKSTHIWESMSLTILLRV